MLKNELGMSLKYCLPEKFGRFTATYLFIFYLHSSLIRGDGVTAVQHYGPDGV